jgi:hypothetical protein
MFVWCCNLATFQSRSEALRTFCNVMLKKDWKDHLDRSCDRWSITRVKEGRKILHTRKRRIDNWIGNFLRGNFLLKSVNKGNMAMTRRRGRKYKQLLDNLKEKRRYWKMIKEILDHTVRRTRFRIGYGPVVRQATNWMSKMRWLGLDSTLL